MRADFIKKYCNAGLTFLLLQSFGASAAIVTDSVAPVQFSGPTATELANATDFIFNGLVISAGSIVNPLRGAPTDVLNLGLDAPEPSTSDEDAESLEIGVVRLPTPSFSCPAETPVTITISEWSLTLLSASPDASGVGSGGSLLLDSRDRTTTAPATAATLGGGSDPTAIGQSSTRSEQVYVGTFADLPFLTFMAGLAAVEIGSGVAYQSGYRLVVPSLTLEYDNAHCSAAMPGSTVQTVPALGFLHLMLLIFLLPITALKWRLMARCQRR